MKFPKNKYIVFKKIFKSRTKRNKIEGWGKGTNLRQVHWEKAAPDRRASLLSSDSGSASVTCFLKTVPVGLQPANSQTVWLFLINFLFYKTHTVKSSYTKSEYI